MRWRWEWAPFIAHAMLATAIVNPTLRSHPIALLVVGVLLEGANAMLALMGRPLLAGERKDRTDGTGAN